MNNRYAFCKALLLVIYIDIIIFRLILPTINMLVCYVRLEALAPPVAEFLSVFLGAIWLSGQIDKREILWGLLLGLAFTPISIFITDTATYPYPSPLESLLDAIYLSFIMCLLYGLFGSLLGLLIKIIFRKRDRVLWKTTK
ncbi:MAG: hypothetical protein M1269_08635 [Chloroflexi bacterium]|nr:hypothetical protein [Chloroflexota bacterium]